MGELVGCAILLKVMKSEKFEVTAKGMRKVDSTSTSFHVQVATTVLFVVILGVCIHHNGFAVKLDRTREKPHPSVRICEIFDFYWKVVECETVAAGPAFFDASHSLREDLFGDSESFRNVGLLFVGEFFESD